MKMARLTHILSIIYFEHNYSRFEFLNTTIQDLSCKILDFKVTCSLRLHLFDEKYNKNSKSF